MSYLWRFNFPFETILSALVENSIQAEARNIGIFFKEEKEGNKTSISEILIYDDGNGISNIEQFFPHYNPKFHFSEFIGHIGINGTFGISKHISVFTNNDSSETINCVDLDFDKQNDDRLKPDYRILTSEELNEEVGNPLETFNLSQKTGTLIRLRKLNDLKFKLGKTFVKHLNKELGEKLRHLIHNEQLNIFGGVVKQIKNQPTEINSSLVYPLDFLLTNTNQLDDKFFNNSFFTPYKLKSESMNHSFVVAGTKETIQIKASHIRKEHYNELITLNENEQNNLKRLIGSNFKTGGNISFLNERQELTQGRFGFYSPLKNYNRYWRLEVIISHKIHQELFYSSQIDFRFRRIEEEEREYSNEIKIWLSDTIAACIKEMHNALCTFIPTEPKEFT